MAGSRARGSRTARRLVALVVSIAVAASVAQTVRTAANAAPTTAAPTDQQLAAQGLRRAAPGSRCAGTLEMIALPGHCTHGNDSRTDLGTAADIGTPGSLSNAPTASIPCYGTGQNGYREQALYVHQTGGADNLSTLAAGFGTIAQHIEGVFLQSGQKTGANSYLRFATNADCSLSILDVAVSATAMTTLPALQSELGTQGYDRTDRHYLAWVDAAPSGGYCGIGNVFTDDSFAPTNANNQGNPMYAAVHSDCWNYGEPHEIMHTLGAVQPTAPHATLHHHCYDQSDVMCYDDGSGIAMQNVCPGAVWYYDCNNDDYFSNSPPQGNYLATHWNTANSHYVLNEPSAPAVATLPAMSNGAYGGYVTAATIQNTGSLPATVSIAYFDQGGTPVGTGDTIRGLAANASWTVRQDNGHGFPATGGDAAQAGSAIIYSTQPVAAFVNEFAPGNAGDATSYTGIPVPSGVGTTLYAPTIVNNAYGGYTTGIGLLNQGATATDVTITYRNAAGVAVKTQSVPGLAANAYQGLFSGAASLGLPDNFAGTATITGSAGAVLGAIVNEIGPGGQFSSYDTVPVGSTSLSAPAALNSAFGGYNTGMGIQNTSGTAGTVSVSYFDSTGALSDPAKTFQIAANGYVGVYQGGADGPSASGAYTAVIVSTLPLAAIVNEVAPTGAGAARQSTSYNAFPAGRSTLHLPLVENAGPDPWNTGEGIMNTGTVGTTVTVTYYNAATGAAVGTPKTSSLAPQAFLGLYQPDAGSGLPAGSLATAVVTTTGGGLVAVICNESGAALFMSYDGQ